MTISTETYLIDIEQDEIEQILAAIEVGLSILRSEKELERIVREFNTEKKKPPQEKKRELEDIISRALLNCFKEAKRKFEGLMGNLLFQIPIQPEYDQPYSPIEEKKPDFSWELHNSIDTNNQNLIYFHIECKRLGTKTSSSWSLNKKYVKEGIQRFIDEQHQYGRGSKASAMVGYVEDMLHDDILSEVNKTIEATKLIPQLPPPANGWQIAGPSHMEHTLTRTFPISPFQLHHFWVDLRGCYDRSILKKSATA